MSRLAPRLISRQLEQRPQGVTVGPFSQFRDRARILAALVFPQPLGPENKYAWAICPVSIELFSVAATNSCPTSSSKSFGRRLVAVTSYAIEVSIAFFRSKKKGR
jgi:hypothetical protein